MSNCQGVVSVYTSRDACLGVCARLPPGDPSEPTGNSVTCRLGQAQRAGITPSRAGELCSAAGPGGNGLCGSDCEAYCLLYDSVCPSNDSSSLAPSCLNACGALKDQPVFDALPSVDQVGDTVECRLLHLSNASTASAEHATECLDAAIFARDFNSTCLENPGQPPKCEDYCRFVMTLCEAPELAVYEDTRQCLATCQALDLGDYADETQDTIGCRLYHAHNAALSPETHCSHTGLTGDGHCGQDPCEPYCKVLHRACEDQFDVDFASGEPACVSACHELDGARPDAQYSVEKGVAGGDNLYCRALHAVRALSDASASCAAAFGAAPCL
jgi:hypothetical protein